MAAKNGIREGKEGLFESLPSIIHASTQFDEDEGRTMTPSLSTTSKERRPRRDLEKNFLRVSNNSRPNPPWSCLQHPAHLSRPSLSPPISSSLFFLPPSPTLPPYPTLHTIPPASTEHTPAQTPTPNILASLGALDIRYPLRLPVHHSPNF